MTNDNWSQRTELLLGNNTYQQFKHTHILIVGLGGVGAYAAEMLCRAGIGEFTLVDGDVVANTNINRQLIALHSTIGKPKTEVLAARMRDINPEVILHLHHTFLRDEATTQLLDSAEFDYVVDAIDTLAPKVFLLYYAKQKGYPVISSMGAGGKLDAQQVRIAPIEKSEYCHLARAVRKRLHHLGVHNGITVVYSPEPVATETLLKVDESNKLTTTGTISYLPAVFGCNIASLVVQELIKEYKNSQQ